MKIFILLATFAVAIASGHSVPEFVDGLPVQGRLLSRVAAEPNAEKTCAAVGFVCPAECETEELWYCASVGEAPVLNIACEKGETCNGQDKGKAQCSTKQADTCGTGKDFGCPKPNRKYPDLTNCRRYYVCGTSVKGIALECPAQYVYNHAAGKCQRQRVATDCVTLSCNKTNAVALPYPPDKSIYGICLPTGGIHLAQCSGVEEHDGTQCTFTCKAEGEFPKSDSCSEGYYICIRNGSRFDKVDGTCPSGTHFSSDTGSCEIGDCTTTTVTPSITN